MEIFITDRGQAFTREAPSDIWQHQKVRRQEHHSIGDARGVAALYREDRTTPGGMRDVAYLAIERDGTHSLYSKPDSDCGLIREQGTWTDQELQLMLADFPVDDQPNAEETLAALADEAQSKAPPPASYGQQIAYGLGTDGRA